MALQYSPNEDALQDSKRKWCSTNSVEYIDMFHSHMDRIVDYASLKCLPLMNQHSLRPRLDHSVLHQCPDKFRSSEMSFKDESRQSTYSKGENSFSIWNNNSLEEVPSYWLTPPCIDKHNSSKGYVNGVNVGQVVPSLSLEDVRTQPLLSGYMSLVSNYRVTITREEQAKHCRQRAEGLLLHNYNKDSVIFKNIAQTLEKCSENFRVNDIGNRSICSSAGIPPWSARFQPHNNLPLIPRKPIPFECQLASQTREDSSKEVNGMFFLQDTNAPASSPGTGFLFATDTNRHRISVRHFPDGESVIELQVFTMAGKPAYPVSVCLSRFTCANMMRQSSLGALLVPELIVGARNPHNCVLRVAAFSGGPMANEFHHSNADLENSAVMILVVKAITLQEYGRGYLRHVKCTTVDKSGNILVLENKIMRISIFEPVNGLLLSSFIGYELDFPIDFCVDVFNRILVANNSYGCVNIYNYAGSSLGTIGGHGLTNHCGAVVALDDGRIVVFDNHNSFNLTIFNRDGYLLESLCSSKSHAQVLSACVISSKENILVCSNRDYTIHIFHLPVFLENDMASTKIKSHLPSIRDLKDNHVSVNVKGQITPSQMSYSPPFIHNCRSLTTFHEQRSEFTSPVHSSTPSRHGLAGAALDDELHLVSQRFLKLSFRDNSNLLESQEGRMKNE